MTEKHLILRTCNADMTSRNGFKWPRSGHVAAPDWNPEPECGNGLHGFLRGEGDGGLADWSSDAVWLVAEVETYVDLEGKVKFPAAHVIFAGSRLEATAIVKARYPDAAVIGANVAVEDRRVAVVGDYGTATAGDYGTATAGYRGTATAGNYGTATAGDYGTATAGDRGTATAGNWGTATAGDAGTATAGYWGTATAGEGGMLQIYYYDRNDRRRLAVAYVGEKKIKPNVRYRLDSNGKFVEA
jgi:hypothetical protein